MVHLQYHTKEMGAICDSEFADAGPGFFGQRVSRFLRLTALV